MEDETLSPQVRVIAWQYSNWFDRRCRVHFSAVRRRLANGAMILIGHANVDVDVAEQFYRDQAQFSVEPVTRDLRLEPADPGTWMDDVPEKPTNAKKKKATAATAAEG